MARPSQSRHRFTLLVAAGAAAGITLVAGCGSTHSSAATKPAGSSAPGTSMPASSSMPGMSMPASGSASKAVGAPVTTNAIAIQNFAFSPATVPIKAGTTITWTNRDQDAHTVTATKRSFHSATLNTGDTFRHTFTTPGTYEYLCTIHPFMTATIVVTK